MRCMLGRLNSPRNKIWGKRCLSKLSGEDKQKLKRLLVKGDRNEVEAQLVQFYNSYNIETSVPSKSISYEKIVANLYQNAPIDAMKESAEEALNLVKLLKADSNEMKSYVRCVELLEAFLAEDQLDMAYQVYLQIVKQYHYLDSKALEMFVETAAESLQIPYILEVFERHLPSQRSIMSIAEPFILSGHTKKLSLLFDRYLQNIHSRNPLHLLSRPWELIQILQEILKGRVRRQSAAPLKRGELRGLEDINASLDRYHKFLMDYDGGLYSDHIDYLLTNLSAYCSLPQRLSQDDLLMYYEDFLVQLEEGQEIGDTLYKPLSPYLTKTSHPVSIHYKPPTRPLSPSPSSSTPPSTVPNDAKEVEVASFPGILSVAGRTVQHKTLNFPDLTAELQKRSRGRRGIVRPLYSDYLYPQALQHEALLVHAVISQVFEPYEYYETHFLEFSSGPELGELDADDDDDDDHDHEGDELESVEALDDWDDIEDVIDLSVSDQPVNSRLKDTNYVERFMESMGMETQREEGWRAGIGNDEKASLMPFSDLSRAMQGIYRGSKVKCAKSIFDEGSGDVFVEDRPTAKKKRGAGAGVKEEKSTEEAIEEEEEEEIEKESEEEKVKP